MLSQVSVSFIEEDGTELAFIVDGRDSARKIIGRWPSSTRKVKSVDVKTFDANHHVRESTHMTGDALEAYLGPLVLRFL
jgi:hypothetical protein